MMVVIYECKQANLASENKIINIIKNVMKCKKWIRYDRAMCNSRPSCGSP